MTTDTENTQPTSRDLLKHVLDKNFIDASTTFDSLVKERIQPQIFDKKVDVAGKIFNNIGNQE